MSSIGNLVDHPSTIGGWVGGLNPAQGPVAQRLEQRTHNP